MAKVELEEVGREHPHLPTSLEAHQEHFGGAPQLLAADRGLYSAENERFAQEAGVKHVVVPKSGKPSEKRKRHEKQRWFRRGFRFRAGIEGRISVLNRAFGLDLCLDHAEEGMQRGGWDGASWRTTSGRLPEHRHHARPHKSKGTQAVMCEGPHKRFSRRYGHFAPETSTSQTPCLVASATARAMGSRSPLFVGNIA
jgi:hypothetical protein